MKFLIRDKFLPVAMAIGIVLSAGWTHGQDRATPAAGDDPQPAPTPLARNWVGSETLENFGELSFELQNDGVAIMHDTVGDAKGTWRRAGDTINLRFANGRVIYNGTLSGNTLSGVANNQNTTWTFSVSAGKAPPLAPLPRDCSGNETLEGFDNLGFELRDDGVAIMRDTVGDAQGVWRRAGDTISLRFANGRVVYNGTLRGNTFSGVANNQKTTWAFSVNSGKAPPLAPLPRDWDGKESLENYDKLSFELRDDGVAIMRDVTGDAQGVWRRAGDAVSLRFANGRVVYNGILRGNTLSGIANNERTRWSFCVRHVADRQK